MVDGCRTGDLGQNLAKPLLNIEVSSLVRVQEDRFSYTVVIFYLIWSLFMLIIMIIPSESTRFLTGNV